jgi:hypothetical protein
MKNVNKWLLAVIAILLFILWVKSCDDNKQTTDVVVPEVSNELPKQEPIYITKKDTVYITKWRYKDKIVHVQTKNPVNDSLAIAYQQAKDSLDRFKLYLSAIQIRDFTTHFEDDYLDLTVDGQVQGELKWLKPNYIVKERTIQVPQKQVAFRLLLGGQVQNNLQFSDFNYNANLGLQNAKGNIFRVGYSKLSGQDYIMLGYDFSVFTIKR